MMSSITSWKALTVAAAAVWAPTASAQTWSSCNPTVSSGCPADTALGMTISIDFTQGGVNSFTTSGGTPSYGSDGATFTVAKSGDSPQINSLFYIMFGRVEVTMKAAPGQGIVSSVVLQSDDLDEIDFEWLGGKGSEVQTNYFGKGNTANPNLRGLTHTAANNQGQYITYVIDWTADRIIWSVGGTAVRTLKYNDAISGQYPQTPMQLKIGSWAGGDSGNPQGTIDWAGGLTNYAQGPFSMHVKSLVVADYSTGKSYKYGDMSGTWQSIQAEGGAVNGRKDTAGSLTVTASAAAITNSLSPTVPAGGIAQASKTSQTGSYSSGGTIPSGWVMTPSGRIVPASSNTGLLTSPSSLDPLASASWPPSSAATPEILTTTDASGFQTTIILSTASDSSPTALQGKATAAPPTPGAAFIVLNHPKALLMTMMLSFFLAIVPSLPLVRL